MAESILIVDDHPLFRDALKVAVSSLGLDCVLVTASSLQEAQTALQSNDISLVLLDIHLDDCDGFRGLVTLQQSSPGIPILICSASEETDTIRRALELGAAGFIPKSSQLSDICSGITRVLDGEIYTPSSYDADASSVLVEPGLGEKFQTLTPAQMRVLGGVVDGLLNKQIAYDMGISEATVKAHMTAIFRKLGVTNRTQVVLLAKDLDVADPSSAVQQAS